MMNSRRGPLESGRRPFDLDKNYSRGFADNLEARIVLPDRDIDEQAE